MRSYRFLLAVVAVFVLGYVPAPAEAAGQSVSMKSSQFNPKDVTIKAGETVTWKNDDSLGHSVTADDGSFDSHPQCGQLGGACMKSGETFSHAFPRPGRYAYYCRNHGARGGQGMAGTVVVQ